MDNLPRLATKYYLNNIRGDIPPDVLAEIESRAEIRRQTGRYTLIEAAVFAEINANANPKSILNSLVTSYAMKELRIYRPGQNSTENETFLSRPWSDEAYWDDLNDWFNIHEPRIGSIFPNPSGDSNSGLTRREQQIQAIENAAAKFNFPPQSIPQGGKKKLKEYCKENYSELFGGGNAPFDEAWKAASKSKRIQIKDREKYMPR